MICGIKIQTKIKFKIYADGESNNKNSERWQKENGINSS